MNAGAASVLVLSHLYPSPTQPYRGSFVARQVRALREQHGMRVVAPTRWVPPLTAAWRAERRVPKVEVVDGVPTWRPRTPQLPFGGIGAEARVVARVVRPTVERLHADRGIDLVHAHFGLPDGWAGASIADELGVPLVLSVWGSDILVFPRAKRLRRLVASALLRADAVIAPARTLADRVLELGAPPDRVSVIMGGVPDDYATISHRDARVELGVETDRPLVVWVGNLVPVKRPLLAVEAMSFVAQHAPDAVLVIVGGGPERESVMRAAGRVGLDRAVRLVGVADRITVAHWQAAADVVVNTSVSEGVPFALAEALVLGTRVAAVPVGGIPELLSVTEGGTLATDATPRAVANALLHEIAQSRDPDLPRRSRFLLSSNVAPRIGEVYAEVCRT